MSPVRSGIPDFNIVDIDPRDVATALQSYVSRGSKLTGVSLDDINVEVATVPDNPTKATLVDLLKCGMKLFDAIVWLTSDKRDTKPLVKSQSMKPEEITSMHEIARSVFYVYFFLVTQARYPAARTEQQKPNVANFLKVVMGMTMDQHVYIERICSFAPQKFDAKWAQHVAFTGLGQEVLSRFGLGVAGYRLFGPFKYYEPKTDIPGNLQAAVSFARSVARAPPTWDIHPLTRNPAVLTRRGNLNKNLGNLILEVFSEDQIQEMVNAKVLYSTPIKLPTYQDYKTWGTEDDISGNTSIFRD